MKLLKGLLQIRCVQLIRIFQELGVFRSVIVIFLLGATILELTQRLKSENQSVIFITLVLITVFSSHLYRKDKLFFRTFNVPAPPIFFAEYLIYTLPCIIVLFIVNHFAFGLIFMSGLFAISWIPFTINSKGKALPIPFVSSRHYELISGLRRIYIPLIIIYLSGIFLAKFTITIPITIFLITSIFIEFNLQGEPQEFLEIIGLSPRKFLLFKIKNQLYFFGILTLPLMSIFMILHTQYWWIILPIFIYSMLVITIFILGKYHFYRPNELISEPSFFNMLFLFGGFFVPPMIPVIIPLSIIFMVRTYRKAIENLNSYISI